MKFTQEQAFSAIKAKMPADRVVSDRSINETLENLMVFATEETELADFVKSTYPAIKTMDGNLRSEVALKAKEIEDKHKPSKTPEQIEEERKAAEEAAKEIPTWYKKEKEDSEKRIQELQDKLSGQESQKTAAERQAAILGSETTKRWNANIIEIATEGFDFSKETADADFTKRIEFIGSKMGVKPIVNAAGGTEKPASERFAAMKESLVKSGMINISADKVE